MHDEEEQLHHLDMYIIPIQYWIEESYRAAYQLEKQFGEVLHAYDLPSNPSILNILSDLHFLINMSLLWLVTKDNGKNLNSYKMLRWLHWIYHFT